MDQDLTPEQITSSKPETRSDARARRGLLFAWLGFIFGSIAWILGVIAVIGFRNDADTELVLATITIALGFGAVVLAWIAKSRVRESNLLHAALDFISSFAWHIAWTSALFSVLVGVVSWQARSDEIERIQEETYTG